jgi:hypothetical protein
VHALHRGGQVAACERAAKAGSDDAFADVCCAAIAPVQGHGRKAGGLRQEQQRNVVGQRVPVKLAMELPV